MFETTEAKTDTTLDNSSHDFLGQVILKKKKNLRNLMVAEYKSLLFITKFHSLLLIKRVEKHSQKT